MQRGFPAGQAARLAGVSYKTLDFWARTGFITPSVVPGIGKGSDRIYSFQDIVALRVAAKLREEGVGVQKLRKVVRYLQEREGLESPLAQTYLVSNGRDVYERRGEEITSLLQRPGQLVFAWVLDLQGIIQEVHQRATA